MTDMTVSKTIFAQLGGNKFVAMTGAYSLTSSDDSLSMRLPRGPAGSRVGGVRITLDGNDTYTLKAFKLRGMKIQESYNESGIYCDQLRATFEQATGLFTSL